MSTNIRFGIPKYSKSNNKINRLDYGIYLVPFYTCIKYFKNYENIYFLILAMFQLATLGLFPKEWSPTGPFSTAIPLAICVVVEIITDLIKWCTTWKQDKNENNKIFNYVNGLDPYMNFHKTHKIKNEKLHPGHIIFLKKNEITPVDGILIDTLVAEEKYGKINLSLLTGESNIHYVPKPNNNFSIKDYEESELIISKNDSDHLSYVIESKTDQIILTKSNFINAGSIIKSNGVYIWVVACGKDKQNKLTNISSNKKYSRIDQFIGEYMMRVSVTSLILLVTVISLIKTLDSTDPNFLTFLLFCVQNWILFNGIIPFSVKIFMILARNLEAYFSPRHLITVNDSLQIDDFGKIQKIVCDKTGTVTKNELEFTKLIATDSDNIIDVKTFNSEKHQLSSHQQNSGSESDSNRLLSPEFYKNLGICIHQTEDDFATIEDKIIRAGYKSLGGHCVENKDEIILSFAHQKYKYHYIDVNGLDFTFDRKMSSKIVRDEQNNYFIYSKGAIDTIYQKINDHQQNELRRIEKIMCQKYPELRLLAFGYKKLNTNEIANLEQNIISHSLENDLMFLGIIGIKDILQHDVLETINKLSTYGIHCSLCTGDRKITAIAVAEEVNIINSNDDLIELSDLNNNICSDLGNKTLIFGGDQIQLFQTSLRNQECSASLRLCKNFIGYNMSPVNKKQIIEILESSNVNTLAIGDGFNDIPMFNSASISVAISGNNSVENSADFTVKQFHCLDKLFDLSIDSYQKNAELINFTFYRCSTVIYAIVMHCLINYHNTYTSPFNGFVLQAFNFAWTICGLIYIIIKKPIETKSFLKIKNLVNTTFVHTSKWNIIGALNGISIICFCYHYQINRTEQFNNILALIVITLLNIKLASISRFSSYAQCCSIIGVVLFCCYLIYIQSMYAVCNAILQLPIGFYSILLFQCVVLEFVV